jgi:hypothetical protein
MKDHQIIRTGNISPIYVGAAFVGVDFAAGSSRARAAVDCVSTNSSAPTETGLATRREIYTYCHSRRLSQREHSLRCRYSHGYFSWRNRSSPCRSRSCDRCTCVGRKHQNVLRIVQIPRKNKTFFVDADQLTCRAEAMEVKAAPQATIEVSCMFDEYEELLDLDGSEFLRAGAEVAMKA